jgi:hypothetical protein
MNQWHTGGSGSDGRYYLGLVCVKATYSYIQVQHLFEIRTHHGAGPDIGKSQHSPGHLLHFAYFRSTVAAVAFIL